LSFMAFRDFNAYVPGIKDLVHGNPSQGIIPVTEKIAKGKLAIEALKEFKAAKRAGNATKADSATAILNGNFQYFGYGFLDKPQDAIPPVSPTFYSFRIMVMLGMWFVLLFMLTVYFVFYRKPEKIRWYLYLSVLSIPLAYLASESGWIVAELGRQPWVIQDLMPASVAVSRLTTGSVQTTFILFAVTFTLLLIADIKIMTRQIKTGPKDGGTN